MPLQLAHTPVKSRGPLRHPVIPTEAGQVEAEDFSRGDGVNVAAASMSDKRDRTFFNLCLL